jgi:lipopolysaccharide export LptBFGC system permease protein LptF
MEAQINERTSLYQLNFLVKPRQHSSNIVFNSVREEGQTPLIIDIQTLTDSTRTGILHAANGNLCAHSSSVEKLATHEEFVFSRNMAISTIYYPNFTAISATRFQHILMQLQTKTIHQSQQNNQPNKYAQRSQNITPEEEDVTHTRPTPIKKNTGMADNYQKYSTDEFPPMQSHVRRPSL